MSDKPVAFVVTAIAVAPICILCAVGPVVVGGFLAGWFGWLASFSILEVAAVGLAGASVVIGFIKFRRARRPCPVEPNLGSLQ